MDRLFSWLRKKLGINELCDRIEKDERTIVELKKHIDVGIDLHARKENPNWAVFCIEGKRSYVRFVELQAKELRELQYLIGQYEREYGNEHEGNHHDNWDDCQHRTHLKTSYVLRPNEERHHLARYYV